MGRAKAPNQKAVAGNERKAEVQATKDAASAREREAAETVEWSKGSNARGTARGDAAALKADDAARKRREKAELLAAEEEDMKGSGKPKKAAGAGMATKKGKKKKKKTDELGLLEEALVGAADKKSKAAKKKEREKKEREEKLRKEKERKAAEASKGKDPLLANTDAMIGPTSVGDGDDADGLGVPLTGRAANVAAASGVTGSGIDGALSALTTGDTPDQHPEKRMKALHRAFEERMMPEMKEDYPGLRQAQYKEKIFQLWKKSSENPMNRPK